VPWLPDTTTSSPACTPKIRLSAWLSRPCARLLRPRTRLICACRSLVTTCAAAGRMFTRQTPHMRSHFFQGRHARPPPVPLTALHGTKRDAEGALQRACVDPHAVCATPQAPKRGAVGQRAHRVCKARPKLQRPSTAPHGPKLKAGRRRRVTAGVCGPACRVRNPAGAQARRCGPKGAAGFQRICENRSAPPPRRTGQIPKRAHYSGRVWSRTRHAQAPVRTAVLANVNAQAPCSVHSRRPSLLRTDAYAWLSNARAAGARARTVLAGRPGEYAITAQHAPGTPGNKVKEE
jgi:hypothetical protein